MPAAIRTLALAALACLCPLAPAAEEDAPTTHQAAARCLVRLLADTAACLATCTGADSVQAALPRLQELAARAAAFRAAQNKLPEPTTQDYLAGQELLGEFNTAWQAIRDHIDRLENSGLMTPELRAVLCIEAPQQPESAATP